MLKGNGVGDGSGAHCAMLAGLDLLGCVIVGVTTAVGGGTFRDVVLGKQISIEPAVIESTLVLSGRGG